MNRLIRWKYKLLSELYSKVIFKAEKTFVHNTFIKIYLSHSIRKKTKNQYKGMQMQGQSMLSPEMKSPQCGPSSGSGLEEWPKARRPNTAERRQDLCLAQISTKLEPSCVCSTQLVFTQWAGENVTEMRCQSSRTVHIFPLIYRCQGQPHQV